MEKNATAGAAGAWKRSRRCRPSARSTEKKGGLAAGDGNERFHLSEIRKILASVLGGDRAAVSTIRSFGTWIGKATTNLFNILNPDIVVFSGEYCQVEDIITDPINKAVQARAWPVVKRTKIVFTDFGIEAEVRVGGHPRD